MSLNCKTTGFPLLKKWILTTPLRLFCLRFALTFHTRCSPCLCWVSVHRSAGLVVSARRGMTGKHQRTVVLWSCQPAVTLKNQVWLLSYKMEVFPLNWKWSNTCGEEKWRPAVFDVSSWGPALWFFSPLSSPPQQSALPLSWIVERDITSLELNRRADEHDFLRVPSISVTSLPLELNPVVFIQSFQCSSSHSAEKIVLDFGCTYANQWWGGFTDKEEQVEIKLILRVIWLFFLNFVLIIIFKVKIMKLISGQSCPTSRFTDIYFHIVVFIGKNLM